MINKEEVFLYLNSGVDKSGYLKKEIGFSKKFPELYQEFLKVDFSEELKEFPFKQRLWHFLKDDYTIPTCKVCGNKINFIDFRSGYNNHCSISCSMKDENVQNKRKKTCLEKYGVEHYNKTEESKEKIKNTCLEKYGVENPTQSIKIKEKIKNTCLEKYGVESYTKTDECKKKKKQTCFKKYGVEYYSQTDDCKEKYKQTNLEKYGVEYYSQTNEYKEKIKNTCLEKYGVEHYNKTEESKEKHKNTNLKKYGVESVLQSEEIKEKIKETNFERYGVENYAQTDEYKNKVKITCLEKYGVEYYFQSDDKKKKSKETCVERYGVEHYSQTSKFAKYHRKQIEYDGLTFDSNWEVIVYKYCKENNISCEYQPDIIFEYEYNDKKHYYHPDFLINGKLYEVKGDHFFDGDKMICPYNRNDYMDGLFEAKHQCMLKNGVIILRKGNLHQV